MCTAGSTATGWHRGEQAPGHRSELALRGGHRGLREPALRQGRGTAAREFSETGAVAPARLSASHQHRPVSRSGRCCVERAFEAGTISSTSISFGKVKLASKPCEVPGNTGNTSLSNATLILSHASRQRASKPCRFRKCPCSWR